MKTKTMLASAAAVLFTAGMAGGAAAGEHEAGEGEKVKCEGVNGCKGQSACQTAHSECSGQNSCKGKGWVYLSKEECDKAKAEQQG